MIRSDADSSFFPLSLPKIEEDVVMIAAAKSVGGTECDLLRGRGGAEGEVRAEKCGGGTCLT